MNRIQMACYSLLASAFVLAALVFVQGARYFENRAYADMVINKDQFTIMSAMVNRDIDLIYVLDTRAERILAYLHDPNRKQIELVATFDLAENFDRALGAAGGATPGAGPKRAR